MTLRSVNKTRDGRAFSKDARICNNNLIQNVPSSKEDGKAEKSVICDREIGTNIEHGNRAGSH